MHTKTFIQTVLQVDKFYTIVNAEKSYFKDLVANVIVFTFLTHSLPEHMNVISFNQSCACCN